MFFWLSKIFDFVFSPLSWIVFFFVLAFFLKNVKKKRKFYVISLLLMLFFTNNFIVDEAIRIWEIKDDNISSESNYDYAIVLGGGMVAYDIEKDQIIFRDNIDRIMQALILLNNNKTKKIIISGGSGSLIYRNMKEACLLKKYLSEIGIDTSNIIVECKSDNTYQNAIYTSDILKNESKTNKLLLITSAYHMRRAKACFLKAGLSFDILPTNPIVGNRRYDPSIMLVPSTKALRKWEVFFKEIFGYLIYKIVGYI